MGPDPEPDHLVATLYTQSSVPEADSYGTDGFHRVHAFESKTAVIRIYLELFISDLGLLLDLLGELRKRFAETLGGMRLHERRR
jgi:hypothetical protein